MRSVKSVRSVRFVAAALGAVALFFGVTEAFAEEAPDTHETREILTEEAPALLVEDFGRALETVAGERLAETASEGERLWIQAMADQGVDPDFLRRRLAKARQRLVLEDGDIFRAYRRIKVETVSPSAFESAAEFPVALHAFRLDVDEEYDDFSNDDIYMYFITTHDDLTWGKVTEIYKNLDEGDRVFLSAQDRGVFGPKGEKITPRHHTILDVGVIESDGDDVAQLKKLSDVIVDFAVVALSIYDPQAGAAAAKVRAETKNLLRLIVELDEDDRLATGSVYLTPAGMAQSLGAGTIHEFSRYYEHETFWTHFAYRLNFRLLK